MDAGSYRLIDVPQRQAPEIVLLGVDWQPRALIRAQLIENGFDVVATDSWPATRRGLRPGSKPRVAIVDLKGLENPSGVLRELRVLMQPDRVLVIAAAGTVTAAEISALGFRTISRPVAVQEIVDRAAAAAR